MIHILIWKNLPQFEIIKWCYDLFLSDLFSILIFTMGHRLSCLDTTYCSPEKIPKKIPEIRDCWALPLIKNFCEVVPSVLILQTKVKSAVRFRPWCGHTRRKSAVHRPSTSCVGWIPGILGFSAQMNFTQILIVELY